MGVQKIRLMLFMSRFVTKKPSLFLLLPPAAFGSKDSCRFYSWCRSGLGLKSFPRRASQGLLAQCDIQPPKTASRGAPQAVLLPVPAFFSLGKANRHTPVPRPVRYVPEFDALGIGQDAW